MKEPISHRIVAAILEDLTDRGGLRHSWEDIDDDIQKEIVQKWRTIVEEELTYEDK